MPSPADTPLLDAILDSWDRNNRILVNLLHLVPQDLFDARPAEGSPSIAELFGHIHYVRLVFVQEDAPDVARPVPEQEYVAGTDAAAFEQMLHESAAAVRDAVRSRVETGRATDRHYDHPILMLQHHIWHEGYHHGQIKLTLKLAGRALSDKAVGRGTWGVWMRKTSA
ncbi:MAG: DinB family protein [Vicinamibacterales bacterium]